MIHINDPLTTKIGNLFLRGKINLCFPSPTTKFARLFPKIGLIFVALDVLYIHTVTHRGWIDYVHSGYAHRSSSFSSAASKIARVLRKTLQPGLSVKLSIAKISHDDATSTVAIVTATRSAIALQLWLTPQQKLSREWVQASGLP